MQMMKRFASSVLYHFSITDKRRNEMSEIIEGVLEFTIFKLQLFRIVLETKPS